MPDVMNLFDKLNPDNQKKALRLLLDLLQQGDGEDDA